jgi:hypothetical protein
MTNMFPADLIDEAVFCLVDGVYFKEYEELQALGGSAEAPKDPNIIEVMYDGQPTRIFIPDRDARTEARAEELPDNPS